MDKILNDSVFTPRPAVLIFNIYSFKNSRLFKEHYLKLKGFEKGGWFPEKYASFAFVRKGLENLRLPQYRPQQPLESAGISPREPGPESRRLGGRGRGLLLPSPVSGVLRWRICLLD